MQNSLKVIPLKKHASSNPSQQMLSPQKAKKQKLIKKKKQQQLSGKGGKLQLQSLRNASMYHEKKRTEFDKATAGRNPLVVTITLFKMGLKFVMGIFDEVSDWLYFAKYSGSGGKFSSPELETAMLFFLVAQFAVQVIAWAIIFGKLLLKDIKLQTNEDPIIDVDEQTKNETSFAVWLYKTVKYNIRNAVVIFWSSIKTVPFAFLMMIFQVTKTSPFIIHIYFQKYYKVVLTKELIINMGIENKQQEQEARDKELKKKLQQEKKILRKGTTLLDANDFISDKKKRKQLQKAISLDSNMEPNMATFLFEADIEKYLRMSDTVEAIFEALPMCILQYINNSQQEENQWTALNVITFLTSVLTVMMYCISLIQYLYQDDSETLWSQWRYMDRIKQGTNQYLYHDFPLSEEFFINNKGELLKLQHANLEGLGKVKSLVINLEKSSNDSTSIINSLEYLFPKTQTQALNLKLGNCNMNFNQFQQLVYNSKSLRTNTFIMDLKENYDMLSTGLSDLQTQEIVQGQQHISFNNKNQLQTIAQIDKISSNIKDFTFKEFRANFANCGIRFNDLLILFKGLAPNQFIKNFHLDISCNKIYNSEMRTMNHNLVQDFEYLTDLTFNVSNNYLEEKGISYLLELVFMNFQNLTNLELDFSEQIREILHKIKQKDNSNNDGILGDITLVKSQSKLEMEEKEKLRKKQLLKKIQNSKYLCQQTDINIEIESDFLLKKTLRQLYLKLKNASITNYSLQQISEQLFKHFDEIDGFSLQLDSNPLGNQGLENLSKFGFCHLKNLKQLKIQIQDLREITIDSLKNLGDHIPFHVSQFLIDGRNNRQLYNTFFYDNLVLYKVDEPTPQDGQERYIPQDGEQSQIQQQFKLTCELNRNTLIFQPILLPSTDKGYLPSFSKKDKIMINIEKQIYITPQENQDHGALQILQIKSVSKEMEEENGDLIIGRKSQDSTPPIYFNDTDKSVSRKHARLSFDKDTGKYAIKCISTINPTSLRLDQNMFQLFEECRLEMGRNNNAIQIDILKIGKNDYITQEEMEELGLSSFYSWDFIHDRKQQLLQQQEQEQEPQQPEEPDSDATEVETEEEDDNVPMLPQTAPAPQIQLTDTQILFSLRYKGLIGGGYYIYDLADDDYYDDGNLNLPQSDNEEDKSNQEDLNNPNLTDKQKQRLKYTGGTRENPKKVKVFDNIIRFGTDEKSCDFPLQTTYGQASIAEIHCVIGRLDLGEKSCWYIQEADEVFEEKQQYFEINKERDNTNETFLLLKNKDKFDISEEFQLKGSMELCFGETAFEVQIQKDAKELPATNKVKKQNKNINMHKYQTLDGQVEVDQDEELEDYLQEQEQQSMDGHLQQRGQDSLRSKELDYQIVKIHSKQNSNAVDYTEHQPIIDQQNDNKDHQQEQVQQYNNKDKFGNDEVKEVEYKSAHSLKDHTNENFSNMNELDSESKQLNDEKQQKVLLIDDDQKESTNINTTSQQQQQDKDQSKQKQD